MASPDSWTQIWRSDCLSQDWWSVKWYATENMCSINSINHSINKSECYDLVLTLHISQNKPNRPWGLVCRTLAQTLWAGLIHLVQLIQSRQTTTGTFYNHSWLQSLLQPLFTFSASKDNGSNAPALPKISAHKMGKEGMKRKMSDKANSKEE